MNDSIDFVLVELGCRVFFVPFPSDGGGGGGDYFRLHTILQLAANGER